MSLSTRWRDKFRDARERSKFSQEELAKKTRLSQSAIESYESGRASPRLDKLLLLAEALNVSLDYLFDDTRDESLEIERELRRHIKNLGGVERACKRLGMFDGSHLRPDK